MTRKILAGIVMLIGLLSAQSAIAQTTPVPGLGFRLGDDVAAVKAALRTDTNPEAMPKSPLLPSGMPDANRGKTVLHLRTKGIWAFFDSTGTVYTIRLDAPFAGNVLGVKIGDTAQQVTTKLGNPIKKPSTAFLTMQSYQYVIDDSAYVSYDANDDGVQIILITR
jgi:hypothetical protein